MKTRIVKVDAGRELGQFEEGEEKLGRWRVASDPGTRESISALQDAATYLRTRDTPVAFPTETVYGLGADATRSSAVKGIYAAKGRPSDNPLIVHVSDLEMLRGLLQPGSPGQGEAPNGHVAAEETPSSTPDSSRFGPASGSAPGLDSRANPIPQIYKPLIDRFWPGPLTILLPNPPHSRLAPEVTAGLSSFGARMPSSPLALTLIKLAAAPLAAPSANASTKPSPTAARHVFDDLDGRIDLILDGGNCTVGVESTVVDGMCDPPVVLRPGGVSLDELRSCPGWEGVVKGYKDASEVSSSASAAAAAAAEAPRAPGMKYKHYSPKARVVLYEASCEAGKDGVVMEDLQRALVLPPKAPGAVNGDGAGGAVADGAGRARKIGTIRTRRWKWVGALKSDNLRVPTIEAGVVASEENRDGEGTLFEVREGEIQDNDGRPLATMLDIDLGSDIRGIAQGLFSALRELDRRDVDMIFVDGIDDEGDIAAAVMNRLRKAASETRT